MKKGDKIIFPHIMARQLNGAGIKHPVAVKDILALRGQEVTILEIDPKGRWDNERPGSFRIQEYGFSYPLEWIEK